MSEKKSIVLDSSRPATYERNGYHSINTVDPRDGKIWSLFVSQDLIRKGRKFGMDFALDLVHSVKTGLEGRNSVLHIFHGIRDTDECRGDDDFLCYVVRPKVRHWKGVASPVPSDRLLLVHVNDDRVIFGFYWSKVAPDDSSMPEDYETRFSKKLF